MGTYRVGLPSKNSRQAKRSQSWQYTKGTLSVHLPTANRRNNQPKRKGDRFQTINLKRAKGRLSGNLRAVHRRSIQTEVNENHPKVITKQVSPRTARSSPRSWSSWELTRCCNQPQTKIQILMILIGENRLIRCKSKIEMHAKTGNRK